MAITIKTDEQIDRMRLAGSLVAKTHDLLEKNLKPGITTKELNEIALDFILSNNGIASFKGYNGFPGAICVSINEEVIHGIPGNRKIKNGDIVSIDIGAIIEGYHGDAARTFAVGDVAEEGQKLIDVTRECFFKGIEFARQGKNLFEISGAIEEYVENNSFSVVKDYVGHGIGRQLHEDPQIPNYRPYASGRGPRLQKGMTLAIEPMVNMGVADVRILDDNWTVVTKDGKPSAHYENTVLITDGEPEILTMRS